MCIKTLVMRSSLFMRCRCLFVLAFYRQSITSTSKLHMCLCGKRGGRGGGGSDGLHHVHGYLIMQEIDLFELLLHYYLFQILNKCYIFLNILISNLY